MRSSFQCTRRDCLFGGGAAALLVAASSPMALAAGAGRFPVTLSDAQWRRRLSPAAYSVLRRGATERAGSSPLDRERRRGIYHCAACNNALYRSAAKFDSNTGWPSFTSAIPGSIGTRPDEGWFVTRTEVHCARCGGHLGHVFADGPPPTGRRYCMNGVAMKFRLA